ncbi:LodA/GoxA family CTQ-dependent oxidase [Jiella avicenniae]|uniref:LodA/GoxA family CTQ-dependent oxidase n=1 Tax=Jiella avicenniae TaxID=2907202 RepID=A0A9X1T4M0_9HYPH|nr:LodA/GoxA family CTQ-dependent oxidase [Jiella avicenniae]MCE7028107.1 LodA/GoxA family CTQ-dependent oxidase [Jiella avicenniae]
MTDTIVRAAIHPGIGIARIGNGEEHVLAPQLKTPPPRAAGEMHDADGLLKREAVEFRVYGYDAAGNVVRELTAPGDEIVWTVHLAAKKAGWYKFSAAMDLPQAAGLRVLRRNPDYPVASRDDLRIDPGPIEVAGSAGERATATGAFRWKGDPVDVTLGEARAAANGRLLVLSGKGVSASPEGLPVFNSSEEDGFANATGWYDDVSDGPVDATVRIGGREIPCEGAWVAVAPPNYAPDIVAWRTLLDLQEELWRGAGWLETPREVSFSRHILPILSRLTLLQWVNKGFAAMFGRSGPFDFTDPAVVGRLSRIHGADDTFAQLRREIAYAFRAPTPAATNANDWPWIYGDAFGSFAATDPLTHLPLGPEAFGWLQRWVRGNFVADWDPDAAHPVTIDELPVAAQPAMLNRAPLHFCLADAFHPGCELTWPMRHLSVYSAPFRIRRADAPTRQEFGDRLDRADVFAVAGPLQGQGPGDLTRWMALPWQADTAGCRSGYDPRTDPYLPTFWPAAVPNHVLSEDDYAVVMDAGRPREDRLDAFHRRRSWYDSLVGSEDSMELMVHQFASMGVVERRPGPADDPDFPDAIYVARVPPSMAGLAEAARAAAEPAPATPADRRAQAAGWRSEAERALFAGARQRRGA